MANTKSRCLTSVRAMMVVSLSMLLLDVVKSLKSAEKRWAWLAALVADFTQILVLPLFAGGGFSPADTIIDMIMAALLTRLLGWHWAFFPTLVAELIPGLDLFPTWTAAVFYVTYQDARSEQVRTLPPGPAPVRRS